MENNSAKIEIMLSTLSPDRKKHLEDISSNASRLLLEKNVNTNGSYKVEITERFDKEEPKQFVYFLIDIRFQHVPQQNGYASHITILDMEVYKEDNIDHWLDHNDRINKQNSLYSELEGKVVQDNITTQTTENKIQNEDDMTDEEYVNEQLWLYLNLFTSPSPKKRTNKEYINIFHKTMVMFSNRAMETFISTDQDNAMESFNYIQEAYNKLMSEFDLCDFTSFNKSELEELGFINWKNKMMLLPLWAYPCIMKNNDGLIVNDIHGNKFVVGKNYIDIENKNGRMVVGFNFTTEEGKTKFNFEYDKNPS